MDELPDSLHDSVVEELDEPEEQGSREGVAARLRRRETVLGVLLLVGLLAFVTWQWRDREAPQGDYHAGGTAAVADEWRAAHDAFARVPGYKDADARAIEAERMITVTAALTGVVALRP